MFYTVSNKNVLVGVLTRRDKCNTCMHSSQHKDYISENSIWSSAFVDVLSLLLQAKGSGKILSTKMALFRVFHNAVCMCLLLHSLTYLVSSETNQDECFQYKKFLYLLTFIPLFYFRKEVLSGVCWLNLHICESRFRLPFLWSFHCRWSLKKIRLLSVPECADVHSMYSV